MTALTLADLQRLIEQLRSHAQNDQMIDDHYTELGKLLNQAGTAIETTMLAHFAMQRVAETGRPLVPNKLNGRVVTWWFAGHTADTPVQAVLGATE